MYLVSQLIGDTKNKNYLQIRNNNNNVYKFCNKTIGI